MDAKREIHGLDQTVVMLMSILDNLFAGKVAGWRVARNGFKVEVVETVHNKEGLDITLAIYPIGLPKEYCVSCRFYKYNSWEIEEGVINFLHPAKEVSNFNFTGDKLFSIRPRGTFENFEQIISRERKNIF